MLCGNKIGIFGIVHKADSNLTEGKKNLTNDLPSDLHSSWPNKQRKTIAK